MKEAKMTTVTITEAPYAGTYCMRSTRLAAADG